MSEIAALTVIGNDRPGIVAGVTKVLYELGCNLQDVSSTILSGHFSMMLIVGLPAGVDAKAVESALSGVAGELDLVVTARPVRDAHLEAEQPTHMISVYGADRPGIVYRVADHLAVHDVNITDLSSRVIGSEERPVYALMLEVTAPDDEDLDADLADLKESLGVEVTINPIDADIL